MASHPYTCGLLLAGVLVILGGFGELESPVLAASAKPKNDAKPPVVQPLAPDRQASITLPKVDAKQPARTESSKTVAVAAQGQTPSDQAPRKIRHRQKAGGKRRPPAIVQPKPNLSYHGMLEQPQRYDPSRDRRAGRAPNPQADEILYDHFQELDKNHDGMIDPFERAFGRLDMDRDVSNYKREYPPPPRSKISPNRPRRKAVANISRTGSYASWSACHALVQFQVLRSGSFPTPQYCRIPREYLSFPPAVS